jgi:hypothetical protein
MLGLVRMYGRLLWLLVKSCLERYSNFLVKIHGVYARSLTSTVNRFRLTPMKCV